VTNSNDLKIVLEASTTSLVRWVENQEAIPMKAGVAFLNQPSYASAQALVNALDNVVHVYVAAVSSADPEKATSLNAILHTELSSIWTSGWVKGTDSMETDLTIALAAKTRDWVADLQASGQVSPSIEIRILRPSPGESADIDPDAIGYLVIAGLDQWVEEQRNQQYAERLAEVQVTLGLRTTELARLLKVSREAIRLWFEGAPIAPERWPEIDRLTEITHRLLGYFRAESLPAQIRRQIPGIEYMTPLELVSSRRERDLLQFYEAIFDRQVTQ
jgi:hypothetical protein